MSINSIPLTTLPKAEYCLSKWGADSKQIKNWLFALSGSADRAADTVPLTCAMSVNSAFKLGKSDPPVPARDKLKSELFELGYIAYKSGHSRGSTVDVSLVEISTNKVLDMGTVFDYFGVESHTFFDDISEKQKSNRLILYEIMSNNGFKNYSKEWWHFTLKNEPYQKYFDFLIK